MKITGTMVFYYFVCERELWFFYNKINFDFENEDELIGRMIDNESYKKYLIENSIIDNTISIDRFIKNKNLIIEIKKSKRLAELYKWQLIYYLWYLKKNYGVKVIGKIYYEEERDYEIVVLDEKKEKEIERAIKEIKRIVKLDKPPKVKKKPYCKSCSYYNFCWI